MRRAWTKWRPLPRRPVDGRVRNALRLGAYQLAFAGVPPHAAVGETVEIAPRPARGLVNAVLRRVATAPTTWPDDATRLSVPDWVLDELTRTLGAERAQAALAAMNEAATVSSRDDGYVQDPASQQVAAAVGGRGACDRVFAAPAAMRPPSGTVSMVWRRHPQARRCWCAITRPGRVGERLRCRRRCRRPPWRGERRRVR